MGQERIGVPLHQLPLWCEEEQAFYRVNTRGDRRRDRLKTYSSTGNMWPLLASTYSPLMGIIIAYMPWRNSVYRTSFGSCFYGLFVGCQFCSGLK